MMGADQETRGKYPITEEQLRSLIHCLADLCEHYNLCPVDPKELLAHSEVEEVYGVKQLNKWDVDWLPNIGYSHEECMQYIRHEVFKEIQDRETERELKNSEEDDIMVEEKPKLERKEKEIWIRLCRLFSSLLKTMTKYLSR
jgi:hypothetical protein